MRHYNERFLGWLIALILALIFMMWQMVSCVSVRVITGEGHDYEGSDKTSTGIDSDVKNTTQKDSTSLK